MSHVSRNDNATTENQYAKAKRQVPSLNSIQCSKVWDAVGWNVKYISRHAIVGGDPHLCGRVLSLSQKKFKKMTNGIIVDLSLNLNSKKITVSEMISLITRDEQPEPEPIL